jgi:hypothetical protein
MALLKAVGDILKKLKKPKPTSGYNPKLDKQSHSFNSRQGTDKDTSTMRASPTTKSQGIYKYGVDDRSKSLHRGKKQSEGFKESGHFDRRKSNDRRAETKSAKSNLASGATSALLMAPAAAVGAVAGIANEKRKKRKLNAKKKDVLGAASSVNEEKSIEGTFKKYKKSKLRKATAKDRKELADDSRARY